MKKLKLILVASGIIIFAVSVAAGVWIYSLNQDVQTRLRNKSFLPPTDYYSAPFEIRVGSERTRSEFEALLTQKNYRLRQATDNLLAGDYQSLSIAECQALGKPMLTETQSCTVFQARDSQDPAVTERGPQYLFWDAAERLLSVHSNVTGQNNAEGSAAALLEPELIAQFVNNEPVLQTALALGEMPTQCLYGVLAIEDAKFLEHLGVSLTSIARAALKNVTSSKGPMQGGSTITQQLVKNYFLTSDRTLKRKFVEFFMSLILENHASKDEILETYLNIIYLGQNGPFQIRGFGAAAQHYFGKPIQSLNLPECALMAAIVNSPGLFDPFSKPENALKRRALVLSRMKELEFISQSDESAAVNYPLPKKRTQSISDTAPYYINAAVKDLQKMGIKAEGLKIYLALDQEAQKMAQDAVASGISELEKKIPRLQKLKTQGLNLEGILLGVENHTGYVRSIVGGRSYRMTQFNRAVEAHRQIGSIMKPFVFLSALEAGKIDPLTELADEKFSYKYGGKQSWSPENYGKKYFGTVPAYFALKNSLNAATAKLGLDIGLDGVIDVAHRLGVNSKLESVPSVTLGAFELYPIEVLQAYLTLARFGNRKPPLLIRYVLDTEDRVLYDGGAQAAAAGTDVIAKEITASLVSMMKQTVQTGTAQLIGKSGFPVPAAGKTGTTSDNKDAWFAGFTPELTTVVWVGYDNNTSHGLTGASGPVPIWLQYMKQVSKLYPVHDFIWPEDTEPMEYTEQIENSDNRIELIVKKR